MESAKLGQRVFHKNTMAMNFFVEAENFLCKKVSLDDCYFD
jgi:hypothetical protein